VTNSDAKPKWHLFWRENQLVGTKKEECEKGELSDLENQESG
jgi:hypothetical protein